MRQLIILSLLAVSLTGCISWNTQASLTTKFDNASNSVQDLELSFPNLNSKQVEDSETDQLINFYYQGDATPENLTKVTTTLQSNFAYKEVINLYFKEGEINLANLEVHNLENGYTDLQNYSYSIQGNKVEELSTLQNQTQAKANPQVSKINNHIDYINSTYLN